MLYMEICQHSEQIIYRAVQIYLIWSMWVEYLFLDYTYFFFYIQTYYPVPIPLHA